MCHILLIEMHDCHTCCYNYENFNLENFLRAWNTFLEKVDENISDFEYVFVEQIWLNIIQNAQNV